MSQLEVADMVVEFSQRRGAPLRAVDHVSFVLQAGKTLALVGESGSGKSTIVRALGRLQETAGGTVRLDNELVPQKGRALKSYRRRVQLVFQDPFASLNPAYSVAHHLRRPLLVHGHARAGVDHDVEALLASVNLVPPGEMMKRFPHELSGGQRQRVAIARALAPNPDFLLADEPVSMLDVSIRLEILKLLDDLKSQRNLALLYVTHDLATARHFSSEIMVMYRGQIVERGTSDDVILHPAHPYTRLLASAAPHPERAVLATAGGSGEGASATGGIGDGAFVGVAEAAGNGHFSSLASPGNGPAGPSGLLVPPGEETVTEEERLRRAGEAREAATGSACRFIARCPFATEQCHREPPELEVSAGHRARCWLYGSANVAERQGSGARAS